MTDSTIRHSEKWIWLPKDIYPQNQTTSFSGLADRTPDQNYTVAEFKRKYTYSRKIIRADLRFSGDTVFQLYCNDSIVATGPGAWAAIFWEMKPFGTISILLKRRFIPIQRS